MYLAKIIFLNRLEQLLISRELRRISQDIETSTAAYDYICFFRELVLVTEFFRNQNHLVL